jgi:hypothetical protein
MLAYLDNVSVDHLEEARFYLFVIYAVATACVVIGVYLEKDSFSTSIKDVGWRLLVISLAAEVLLGIAIFSLDSKISDKLRYALLEVRQRTANRDIKPNDMDTMSSALSGFSGEAAEINVFPVNFETVFIAVKIYGVLLNAHWKVSAPNRLSIPPDSLYQGGMIQATADEQSQKAGKALFDALNVTSAGVGFSPQPLPNPEKPRILVSIGSHPAPLRSWIDP